jgi:hypothetical protein
MHGQTTCKRRLTRLTMLRLGGSHHLPFYSILYAWSQGQHPNVILFWDSQVGVSEFPKLGLSQLWRPIILHADLRLRWGLKQSCNPPRELSNNMCHTTCNEIRTILDFSWSRIKLTIWLPALLLAITRVLSTQMGLTSPF